MNAILTTNQDAEIPSIARVVLSLGLLGSFLANLLSQMLGMHFASHGGIALSTTDVAWISFAYTTASFVGMVVVVPLERRLGVREYFVGSALVFAAFGWLQATMPSTPLLLAVRAFEGFTTGGFGPRALLDAFMLYKARRLASISASLVFLLLATTGIALVMFAVAVSVIDWSWWFYVQFAVSAALVMAGLRWLPHRFERSAA
ncbi:MAG TPA: hypothetical protein VJ484_04620 [Lysobacter sp.]|nr:hypothetical protein [Lysobacter sp.]